MMQTQANPGMSRLELTMRETMDTLEELSTEFAFNSTPGCFEILSIESPEEAARRDAEFERWARRQQQIRSVA